MTRCWFPITIQIKKPWTLPSMRRMACPKGEGHHSRVASTTHYGKNRAEFLRDTVAVEETERVDDQGPSIISKVYWKGAALAPPARYRVDIGIKDVNNKGPRRDFMRRRSRFRSSMTISSSASSLILADKMERVPSKTNWNGQLHHWKIPIFVRE